MTIKEKLSLIDQRRNHITELTCKYVNNLHEVKLEYINYLKDCNTYLNNLISRKHKNILILGATGYLGMYLLRELLKDNEVVPIVLLHHTDKTEFLNRIGISETDSKRIRFISGDVRNTYLGMALSDYEFVLNETNVIVNLTVNKASNGEYDDFIEINVKPLERIIGLINHSKNKIDFYQVSTIGVSEGSDDNKEYSFLCEDSSEYNRDFSHIELNRNYYESKYKAEQYLFSCAKTNDLNIHIVRVGNIAFPLDKNPNYRTQDTSFGLLLTSMLRLGIFPDDKEKVLELSFVDDAAFAISKLITHEHQLKGIHVYHVFNNAYYSFNELADIFGSYIQIKKMNYKDMYDYLIKEYESADELKQKSIEYIVDKYLCERGMHTTKTIVVNEKTTKILKTMGVHWHTLKDIEIAPFVARIYDGAIE